MVRNTPACVRVEILASIKYLKEKLINRLALEAEFAEKMRQAGSEFRRDHPDTELDIAVMDDREGCSLVLVERLNLQRQNHYG